MSAQSIYLDYAAATPVDPEVFAAMQPYFSVNFYNPSASYLAAQDVGKSITKARGMVAEVLGAKSDEIIFTAGGTEANNLAISGVLSQFPEANLVVSAVEHESVLAPAHNFNCKVAPVLPDGRVDVPKLISLIDDQTVLVSVMYANNEIGTVQPIKTLTQELQKIRSNRLKNGNKLPLYVHTDAAQATNYLDLHVARLGVDLMTINGGKMYGPKQSGVLYVKAGTSLKPLVYGGGQEHGLRSGTENVPAIIGLATALAQTQAIRQKENDRLSKLQAYFVERLTKKIPNAVINGSIKFRLPNNVHVTFPSHDNERLMMALDEKGIMCATGSACSASSEEPSHVLKAIGLTDGQAQASLRFSFGRGTTQAHIEQTVDSLTSLVAV